MTARPCATPGRSPTRPPSRVPPPATPPRRRRSSPQRVDREAQRRGFVQAPRQAVLGDGALWIWNLADEQFPGALQIVDRFHAKQKLSDVAKDVYGAKSALGAQWAQQRHDELDEGQIDAVLAALGAHAQANDEARKGLDYVTRNRHRMHYAEFRAQGLCTSTGVVEAGCKVAIGTRLQTGRHALDGGRGRRNHRAALLQAQRPLRGLLGAPVSGGGQRPMTSSHNPDGQIHSALASRPSRSARTATLRAPWQPSTMARSRSPGYPYPLASPAAAARPSLYSLASPAAAARPSLISLASPAAAARPSLISARLACGCGWPGLALARTSISARLACGCSSPRSRSPGLPYPLASPPAAARPTSRTPGSCQGARASSPKKLHGRGPRRCRD